MASSNVLITFYSRCGAAEKLALAAGVGAVQARASIRMRRLIDASGVETIPDCRQTHERMRREYVPPAPADVEWADGLILAASNRWGAASGEWTSFLDLLGQLQVEGKLDGKVGTVLVPESDAGEDVTRNHSMSTSMSASILRYGFLAVPVGNLESVSDEAQRALVQGRRVAQLAQILKSGPSTWDAARRLLSDDHGVK